MNEALVIDQAEVVSLSERRQRAKAIAQQKMVDAAACATALEECMKVLKLNSSINLDALEREMKASIKRLNTIWMNDGKERS